MWSRSLVANDGRGVIGRHAMDKADQKSLWMQSLASIAQPTARLVAGVGATLHTFRLWTARQATTVLQGQQPAAGEEREQNR